MALGLRIFWSVIYIFQSCSDVFFWALFVVGMWRSKGNVFHKCT